MRILMLSCNAFPYPPTGGAAENRTFNLLKYLQRRHEVTLVTQRQSQTTEEQIAGLRPWVSDLMVFPAIPANAGQNKGLLGKAGRFLQAVASLTPPNVVSRFSPEIQAWVDRFIKAGQCDLVVCEHSVNEVYIRPEFRQQVRTIVDIHSSVYGWIRNHLEMGASDRPWRDRLYLPLLYQYEKRYCSKFSRLVATTEYDRQGLLQILPEADIRVVANGMDLDLFPLRAADPGGHRLVFVGTMDASHNVDAAQFFTRQVLPKVRELYPETTLYLVGARPVPEVQALAACPGVVVTGAVPSIVEYLHPSTVAVVPLRAGLGIKTKTLEAMAAGLPVVGSDRALEGLTVDGPEVPLRALRANRVEEYVREIGRLFESPLLREQLSYNSWAMLKAEYTWERAGELYEQALVN